MLQCAMAHPIAITSMTHDEGIPGRLTAIKATDAPDLVGLPVVLS
jgi:hypothetical protein